MIKFFSRLPLRALYAFSSFLYLLAFYVVRHRHQVIRGQLEKVFPDDFYASMLTAMPEASDYRPLYGQNQCNVLADGTHTRVKIDLFPEYTRHLPPEKRVVWDVVGRALCSEPVKAAFVRKLAPALARRFDSQLERSTT